MRAGHNVAPVGPGGGQAQHLPLRHRREGHVGGNGLFQGLGGVLAGSQVRVAQGALGRAMNGLSAAHLDRSGLDAPPPGGEIH